MDAEIVPSFTTLLHFNSFIFRSEIVSCGQSNRNRKIVKADLFPSSLYLFANTSSSSSRNETLRNNPSIEIERDEDFRFSLYVRTSKHNLIPGSPPIPIYFPPNKHIPITTAKSYPPNTPFSIIIISQSPPFEIDDALGDPQVPSLRYLTREPLDHRL